MSHLLARTRLSRSSFPLACLAAMAAGFGPVAIAAPDASHAAAPHSATSHASRPNDATVTPIMTRDLPDIPGKEAVMITLEYLPGGKSMPHRHDADVFVYVLEGEFATQVAGQEKVILHKGQSFYESPSDIHEVSANASATKPVKLLILVIKDKNKPVTLPAGDAHK